MKRDKLGNLAPLDVRRGDLVFDRFGNPRPFDAARDAAVLVVTEAGDLVDALGDLVDAFGKLLAPRRAQAKRRKQAATE